MVYNPTLTPILEKLMRVVCLDLEGVLVPEIWINLALRTGIEELKLTTRDIPNYHTLMAHRLAILDEKDIRLQDIQSVIRSMTPLDGAQDFLVRMRPVAPVFILSDTFTQFAGPLMEQLEWPPLLCNELDVSADGKITGYRLRQEDGKKKAVLGFQSMNLGVVAAGDSYNDLSMLQTAQEAAFFRAPDSIMADHPDIPSFTEYNELYGFLKDATARR
jgi:phosphoserine / homoserine phosphotransferase